MSLEEKTIHIYVDNGKVDTIELKFYQGTREADIEEVVKESIENIKMHAGNDKLKVYQRTTATEIPSNALYFKSDSLVLAETEPHHLRNYVRGDDDDPEDPNSPNKRKNVKRSYAPYDPKSNAPVVDIVVVNSGLRSVSPDKKNFRERPKSAVSRLYQNRPNSISKKSFTPVKSGFDQVETFGNGKSPGGESYVTFNPNDNNFSPAQEVNHNPNPMNGANLAEIKSEKLLEIEVSKPQTFWRTGDIGTVSIDGTDPNIYSMKNGIMPFSYMRYTNIEDKYLPKMPPPTYLSYDVLSEKKSYAKEDVFRGLEILKTGELKLVDKEILNNQKGIVTEVLKRLAQSIAEGRGVIGVSLPVRIFEPRSLLERICDWWTFIPNYVLPVAQQTFPPIDRMKAVISFAIGGLYISAKQVKPFNPLLGETFQATFPNHGISIDIEHTSHHPPIANFLVEHKDFRFSGRYNFYANLETNQLILLQEGPNNVDFKDTKDRITFYWAPLKASGMLWGDRTCKYNKYLHFEDKRNRIKAVVKLHEAREKKPKPTVDSFYGKIYKYNPEISEGRTKKKLDEINKNFEDLTEEICEIQGSYLKNLIIGDKEYWNIDKDIPTDYTPVKDPLCSDSRFREDLIWVKRKNFKFAEEWKLKTEQRQREEKKLRVEYSKKHK